MYKKLLLFITFISLVLGSFAQGNSTSTDSVAAKPVIKYSNTPKKYEIAGIAVTGVKNYEDYVLIGFSGLTVGQIISVPGDEITNSVKRFWKHGLFSDVKIDATKIEGNKVWLEIALKQRSRISDLVFIGMKKSDKEDLETKLGLVKGNQVTPNLIDRAKKIIKKHYEEKGFHSVDVDIKQKDDLSKENNVIIEISVDRKSKTKVNKIFITGNQALSSNKIQRTMKKTNEKKRLVNFFRQKKFVTTDFSGDKDLIIQKYNELGYRDAKIVSDSVVKVNDKLVNVYLKLEEGKKYFIRDIKWIGNTVYPSDYLSTVLRMKAGDVYNQKLLEERTQSDEDALANVYMDKGYLFFNIEPVEVNVQNDSIDLEMRIYEGRPATINKVQITGNDRLYEHVIRRELRTKPGQLFSKTDIQRSAREIAQTGHFNPENMDIRPTPNPENGTVDILYGLESKANDQVEFSAGWGQTGIIGKLSLKFTNFSIKNLLNPSTYKGIIPQGDGQTLTISGQTNADYYQSYSMSFMDPWFGGKRPNSFSVSAYYSKQTDINQSYNPYNTYGSNPYTSGYGGYGSSYGGGYSGYGSQNYTLALDPDKYIQMLGLSIGFGKRLSWPDDYFTFSTEFSYQLYKLKDWNYFVIHNGVSNNVSLSLSLSRNSIDNPVFTRSGSSFSLSVQLTPPYSMFDGKDYANIPNTDESKFKWIEYHKWKFKSRTFTPISNNQKLILATRAEYGFVGYYDKNKQSPFETFYMGGDGMSGYSGMYATETIALRGYANGSLTPYGQEGYGYSRLGMELRYPLMLQPTSTIFALAFVEAGNAWANLDNFNPFQLKRSAGTGVRILLPMIGMLGIDWAYGFDKVFNSRQYSGSNFHFIIGQEF
ncbi:MAG: outer membrane protein assembly factor BamA [Bacteroidales bacterium]|nr:outer membrane protein assembly factor BamA [Bacteroidales bacterium]